MCGGLISSRVYHCQALVNKIGKCLVSFKEARSRELLHAAGRINQSRLNLPGYDNRNFHTSELIPTNMEPNILRSQCTMDGGRYANPSFG